VFLGFVAVLACSAAVSAYGVARLRRIGQGLSLLSRPYMPLTRAVSTLEAFHKERVRNTDRLLDEADARARAAFIALDRTYFARVVGERLTYAQQLVGSAQQTASERDALDRISARLSAVSARGAGARTRWPFRNREATSSRRWPASSTPWPSGWRRASGSCAPKARRCSARNVSPPSAASQRRSRTRSATRCRRSP